MPIRKPSALRVEMVDGRSELYLGTYICFADREIGVPGEVRSEEKVVREM